MRFTCRPKPLAKLAGTLALSILSLPGCASDSTFLRQDGAAPDRTRLETDASGCREIGPIAAGFFGGALLGAAEGAATGAVSGGAGPGAIVGAGLGGLIGIVAGAVTSADGDGYDRCMAGKGYHRA